MRTKDAGIYQHPSSWCLMWEHASSSSSRDRVPSALKVSQKYRQVPIPQGAGQCRPRSLSLTETNTHTLRYLCSKVLNPQHPLLWVPLACSAGAKSSREIISKATHLQEPVSSTTLWDTEAEEKMQKKTALSHNTP